jgi:hypothetical protein
MTDEQFSTLKGLLERVVEILENLDQTSHDAAERAELATHRQGCKCGYH